MGGLINYSALPFTVRDNIVTSQRLAWKRLAAPGTWWNEAIRVAIAAEAPLDVLGGYHQVIPRQKMP